MALAAYNAGPNRVKQWRPDEAMPADIWIETIPFKETREYVTNVLVYTLIYQQIMQSSDIAVKTISPDNLLSMNDLTRDVQPSVSVALNQ